MKLTQQLIAKFNTQDTFLVVSGYPSSQSKIDAVHDGMATYTKRTVEAIASKKRAQFVVLVEKETSEDPHQYAQNKVLVLPVFNKKKLTLFPVILRYLITFSQIKKIFIHSEFHIAGGISHIVLLIPFLLLIKLTGKQVYFTSHNAIHNFDDLAPHFNFKKGSLTLKIMNWGIKNYYRTLGKIVDYVVVLDEIIKQRLEKYIDGHKIIVSPHWLAKKRNANISKIQARKKLGIKTDEKVILYFGFLTWYKGADWLVEEFRKISTKNNIRLIMAGGEAYSLKDKKYYEEYYSSIQKKANQHKEITITGFVPENMVATYFQAADLVVLPYRGLIGASGCLSHAIAYNKPFLMSSNMKSLLNEQDIITIFSNSKKKVDAVMFGLNKIGFSKILSTLSDDKKLAELYPIVKEWASIRSEEKGIENDWNFVYDRKMINNSPSIASAFRGLLS